MAFPTLSPSSRSFNPGNFPVKTYRAQSGAEIRVLMGNKRTRMELTLGYKNIKDDDTEKFLDHYHEMQGTYKTFTIPTSTRAGWDGEGDALGAGEWGNAYRYSMPPKVTQVQNGRSNVLINLIGVL